MLNSVTEATGGVRTRSRLSPAERRRQLLGIGLQMLVDKPIQDLSLDAVAAQAGISRGLLFHYFPTKTDYYDAVVAAALRRVARNIAPDEGASPQEALRQIVERIYAQIDRRRDFYLALIFGNGAVSLGGEGVESHRRGFARRVADAARLPESTLPTIHAWVAYVEDRALQWSALEPDDRAPVGAEVDHCCAALHALSSLEGIGS